LKPQLIIQPLLILLIVSASSSLLVNTLQENVSTTMVTERYTTTITTPRTETVDITVTTHTTKISTLESTVTTRRIILIQRTVLVPTTIRTSYITVQTVLSTTCWREGMEMHCEGVYYRNTIGAAAIIRTYVPAIVQEPLTVTSESTIYRTTTETLETTSLGKSTRTTEEPITLTIENVYTSYLTYPATTTTPEREGGANIANLFSSNLMWILVILVALIAALTIRTRRPAGRPRITGRFCVNCGAQIPAAVAYCPHCGAPQEE